MNIVSESYEVVFQQVAPGHVHDLLRCVQMNAQGLSGLTVSEDIESIDRAELDKNFLDKITSHDGNLCVMVQLHELDITGSLILPLVLLRIIKYNTAIDVELSFDDIPSLDMSCVMWALHRYTKILAEKFDVKNFYGGLEPASDINTRYFTDGSLGPMT